MKIYTKTGDKGQTSLLGGTRVDKDHLRIEAYGTLDELNALVGMLNDLEKKYATTVESMLLRIQHQLFAIGSHLAMVDPKYIDSLPKLEFREITILESVIDEMQTELEPLKNFILPGGHILVSQTHICRTVCRRAERQVVRLAKESDVRPLIIPYLNRLSDYFFTLARFYALRLRVEEVQWNSHT